MFSLISAKSQLFEREEKMGSTLYYILMVVLGGLMLGLLLYSFYMVLSSKTDKSQPKKS